MTHPSRRMSAWCPGCSPCSTLANRSLGGAYGECAWPAKHAAGAPCDLCANRWLFIVSIGGRTGSADDKSRDAVLDDAWYAEVPMHPCPVGTIPPDGRDECGDVGAGTWEWLNACPDGCGFPARSGHATVVDLPSESNLFTQRVYVIGGEGQDGSLLGDVW